MWAERNKRTAGSGAGRRSGGSGGRAGSAGRARGARGGCSSCRRCEVRQCKAWEQWHILSQSFDPPRHSAAGVKIGRFIMQQGIMVMYGLGHSCRPSVTLWATPQAPLIS